MDCLPLIRGTWVNYDRLCQGGVSIECYYVLKHENKHYCGSNRSSFLRLAPAKELLQTVHSLVPVQGWGLPQRGQIRSRSESVLILFMLAPLFLHHSACSSAERFGEGGMGSIDRSLGGINFNYR